MSEVTFLLSIDIESEGDHFNNAVTAIGACFGPADGSWPRETLRRFRVNLKPLPGQVMDPDTKREFWDAFPDVYNEIKASHVDAKVAMERFRAFCVGLVEEFEENPAIKGRIKIVTDCPDFDLGRLHHLGEVETKTWPGPIRQLGKTGARRHKYVDPLQRLAVFGDAALGECNAWIAKHFPGVVHDHRPDHDAEHSYYQCLYLAQRLGGS